MFCTISVLIIIIILTISLHQALSQSIEIQKCIEYKKEVFDEVATFGFFLYDAPLQTHTSDTCQSNPIEPFIVGGSPAEPQEFPNIARLGRTAQGGTINWFCGGTLISERYVLTAAHCFYAPVGEVNRVRLGQVDFRKSSNTMPAEDYSVRTLIPHPEYTETNELLYNDIGLIELNRRVTFTKSILPACLPLSSGDEYQSLMAIGWGSTAFATGNSDQLLKVQLTPFSFERCSALVTSATGTPTGLNRRTHMCAGSTLARDTCKGDSGGPLLGIHTEYPCMYYVTAITSTGIGIGCGTPNVPGIYTRVNSFVPWISGIVWNGVVR